MKEFKGLCLTVPQEELLTQLIRCEIEEFQGSNEYIKNDMYLLVDLWISLITNGGKFLMCYEEQRVLENVVRQEITEVGKHLWELEYLLDDATPEEKSGISELLNDWCAILEAVRPVMVVPDPKDVEWLHTEVQDVH